MLVIEPKGVAKLVSYGSLFTWRIPSRSKQRCHSKCTLLVWTLIVDVLFCRKNINEVFRHNYVYSYIRYNFIIPPSKEMYIKGDALAKLLHCLPIALFPFSLPSSSSLLKLRSVNLRPQ